MVKTLRSFTLLDWVFMLGQVSGSLTIALNLGLNVLGYSLFLVSSIAGVLLLWKTNVTKSMIIINLYFTVVNAVGIIRYAV